MVVMCAKRSRANNPQRAGASDVQMAMCFTSKLEGGLPIMTRRRSRGVRAPKDEPAYMEEGRKGGGV